MKRNLALLLPLFAISIASLGLIPDADAAGAISVSARASYIGRVRKLFQKIATLFLSERCKLSFPLMTDRKSAQEWVEKLTLEN